MKAMEQPHFTGHPIIALGYTCLSVVCGIFAIAIDNIDMLVKIGAGVIAMGSGIMAMRYYYYATKEKLQSINKNKNQTNG